VPQNSSFKFPILIQNAHGILSWLMHAQDSFLSILINLIKTESSSSLFIEFSYQQRPEFVELQRPLQQLEWTVPVLLHTPVASPLLQLQSILPQ
jgi:hypothetical protein